MHVKGVIFYYNKLIYTQQSPASLLFFLQTNINGEIHYLHRFVRLIIPLFTLQNGLKPQKKTAKSLIHTPLNSLTFSFS